MSSPRPASPSSRSSTEAGTLRGPLLHFLLLVLVPSLAIASPAAAAARLTVSGAVEPEAGALGVRVILENAGDGPAAGVSVEGELLGATDDGRLEAPLGPGASAGVLLRYPMQSPPSGVFPLLLLIRYHEGRQGAEVGQRAFLLVALGEAAPAEVALSVRETAFVYSGDVTISAHSLDGRPHRARLRVAVPPTLRVLDGSGELAVPAKGEVSRRVRLIRTNAAPGTEQGILAVAESVGEPLQHTTVETGTVSVLPEVHWTARLRVPMIAAALLLFAGAVLLELRGRRPPTRPSAEA